MTIVAKIKSAAIPRAGYDYQDLAGIEVLIRHYRDPDLYDWIALEADESAYRALDDVVAARKDGSFELVQVKFTVDSERYELDWPWLLGKTERGTSLLAKWTKSLVRVEALGPIYSAVLRTNRRPSKAFAECLRGTYVDFDRIPLAVRQLVSAECGGAESARAFFRRFEFLAGALDLIALEDQMRDQLVPSDTDILGWLILRNSVRRWATFKNLPEPDGHISRDHILQIITKKRPHPIRQDFVVPEGYAPPRAQFDQLMRQRISNDANPITILWGTPGRGKSTYLSFLSQQLRTQGAAVTRHHYFLTSEDSSSNRTSFNEISTSLMEQLYVHHPKAMVGVPEDFSKLRAVITLVARNLKANGQRLYIVVDGLDHVWRDTGHVQQLDHLFNELLPLPSNVSLIVGTQKVAEEQLPRRLLSIAKEDDWLEIPSMDEVSVSRWVMQQDGARPLILRFNPLPSRRAEIMEEIASAFFHISRGHPLHLIYAYEGLIRKGSPVSAEDIEQLPACPDGDIRGYYKGLWVRLGPGGKNTLHMLAGSDFFWPGFGIRQVLGDYSDIDFLLEPRNVGMVPFHSSIFAWVRQRQDHAEAYEALLPRITAWLENQAPDYWKWGWLWLTRARAGDYTDLLSGATRDWVVESLVKGWPDRQIENILAVAERKTFDDSDYAQTVAFRSLKTRVSNARKYQSRNFAAYNATALAISQNRQQALNLLDDIQSLDSNDVVELARMGPVSIRSESMPTCLGELVRRVNAYIDLRNRSENDFSKLSNELLSVSALMGVGTVRRALNYARKFRKPGTQVSFLIKCLADAHNYEGLQFIRKTLSSKRWAEQIRQTTDALVRVGSFHGANAASFIIVREHEISLFSACCLLWKNPTSQHVVYMTPIPKDLLRERYSLTSNHDVEVFLIESFWAALRAGLMAGDAPYEIVHPGFDRTNAGWLWIGLEKLVEIASDLAQGHFQAAFSTVFLGLHDLKPMHWGEASEREYAQYRAFRDAIRQIALDLHLLGITDAANTKISAVDFAIARGSEHWLDESWINHNADQRVCFVEKQGVDTLLDDEAERLLKTVTEFGERGEQWATLADLANIYDNERATEFLTHAAECLVGYGYRKDLSAVETLEAVEELADVDRAVACKRLDALAPIIDAITDFTDGDETRHARSILIGVVAKVAPERLLSLYEHHISVDEYSYADECLIEFAKVANLDSAEGAALARTFLDERTLGILEKRAEGESAARTLIDAQNAMLGRASRAQSEPNIREHELSDQEKEAERIDPTSFSPSDFARLIKAASPIHYRSRRDFMKRWLDHWKSEGRAKEALNAISSFFDADEHSSEAEELLDEAFFVSMEIEGKVAAYPWLVKAHIHRHGWQTYWTSEDEIIKRLQVAARNAWNRVPVCEQKSCGIY